MTHECEHCGSTLPGPARHCMPCVEALERPGLRPQHVYGLVAADLTVRWPFYGTSELEAAYADALAVAVSLRRLLERQQADRLDERTRCVHLVQHEARVVADTIRSHRGAGVGLSIAIWSAIRDRLISMAQRLKGGEAAIPDVVDGEGRRL